MQRCQNCLFLLGITGWLSKSFAQSTEEKRTSIDDRNRSLTQQTTCSRNRVQENPWGTAWNNLHSLPLPSLHWTVAVVSYQWWLTLGERDSTERKRQRWDSIMTQIIVSENKVLILVWRGWRAKMIEMRRWMMSEEIPLETFSINQSHMIVKLSSEWRLKDRMMMMMHGFDDARGEEWKKHNW